MKQIYDQQPIVYIQLHCSYLYSEQAIKTMNTKLNMVKLLALLLLITIAHASIEAKLSFPEYCLYHGYPTQTHIIRTHDGYNLKFFRLQAKNTTISPKQKVVYLQHGLQDSADTWVINQEHLAPGFILANRGYDVWVGNSRGNAYSSPLINTKLHKLKTFWDFSFDHMAKYDLPAAFQYIHNKTQKKIHYVGHSQGTMIMFAALADKNPVVLSHLASYVALGPVAYLEYEQSRLLGNLAHTALIRIFRSLRIREVFYSGQSYKLGISILCVYDPIICTSGLSQISEKNNTVNNLKRMPVIMGHFPSGSSLTNMDHFEQIIRKGKFGKYDYGAKKNMEIYGTKEPPTYNLTNIEFPVHMFVGEYDRLADVKDAQRLFKQLGGQGKTMSLLKFGHATFIWGKEQQMGYLKNVIKIIQS